LEAGERGTAVIRMTSSESALAGLVPKKRRKRKKMSNEDATAIKAGCELHGLPEPILEYQWHPTREFSADFAFVEQRLLVEITGGIFGRGKPCPRCKRRPPGAHSSIQNLLNDMDKAQQAAILKWRILPVLPKDVENGNAFALIKKVIG
jgi:hypothetical protein